MNIPNVDKEKSGFDIVTVGNFYAFREGFFFAKVKVIEDNSDETHYRFTLRIHPHDEPGYLSTVPDSTIVPVESENGNTVFDVSYKKDSSGFFGLDMQFYEWDKRPMFPARKHQAVLSRLGISK
ncbi:MAG: hypothetical protein FWG59_07050 [Betaproteobacteria bacterium]|nr:hypothetical protein [Betaproteobacteria bacterium]